MTGRAPDIPALRQRSTELAGSIETVFESAASVVFERLDDMRRVTDLLAQIAETAGSEGRTRLRVSVTEAGTYLDRIDGQYTFLERVSRKLGRNAQELRDLLHRQRRSMRLAAMIATNAQVVSRSLDRPDPALVIFASDVKDILENAGAAAETVSQDLSGTDETLRRVTAGLTRMTGAARALQDVRGAMPAVLDVLAEAPPLDPALRRIEAARTRLTGALQAALTRLQVGDAARQRLEHVGDMLARVETAGDRTREIVAALAEAQLAETVSELNAGVAEALPQLDSIGAASDEARRELAQVTTSGIAAALDHVAAIAQSIADGLVHLDEIRAEILPEMEQLAEGYAHGATSAETIAGLDGKMHLLGMNATLMSSKLGEDGRAMTEIALQLREGTASIGSHSASIVHLAKLQELNAIIFLAPTERAAGEATDTALRALKGEAQRLTEALSAAEEIIGSDRNASVRAAIDRLSAFIAGAGPHLSMPGAVAEIEGPVPPECAGLLTEIRATYTMQAERDLHDRLLPGEGLSAAPRAPVAEAGIEDVFF